MNSLSTHFEPEYDVVIVGARVAGSGLALQLARAGRKILVIDRDPPGRDTISTHALMRGGVQILHRWGILERIDNLDTPAIRKTTFHYNDKAFPVYIKERNGVEALYSPRRTVLDSVLAEAAAEAGATIRHRTRLDQLQTDADGRVTGVVLTAADGRPHAIRSRLVVGADGIDSPVARFCQAETVQEAKNCSFCVYGYWEGIPLDGTHWFYGERSAAGAIPTTGNRVCVFASCNSERPFRQPLAVRLEEMLQELDPDFAAYLRHGSRVGGLIPFKGRKGFIRRARGPGWALIGDAACFKDPITAHGMTDALRDAHELARAILRNTPPAWREFDAGHAHFAKAFLELTDRIAAYDLPMESLQELHKDLSRLMNEECDFIDRHEEIVAAGNKPAPESILTGTSG